MPVRLILTWLVATICAAAAHAADFESHWRGSRTWVGPQYWAQPMQDWRVEDGVLIGSAARNRSVHLLTHQVGDDVAAFSMAVTIELRGRAAQPQNVWGGFQFGLRGPMDDYRHALIFANHWVTAALRADGRLFIGETISDAALPTDRPIRLTLTVTPRGARCAAQLEGATLDGGARASVTAELDREALPGNIALAIDAPRQSPDANERRALEYHFRDWTVRDVQANSHPTPEFGPILWSQYTLHSGVLKLTAQFPPIGPDDDQTARLEVMRRDQWRQIAAAPIDGLSRTATFRIENWDAKVNTPYRVAYRFDEQEHYWPGTIRREPRDAETITMGVFSCDNGYCFPHPTLTRNVAIQNPDLLFFAGDQIYESYGGFGVARDAPAEEAMLDYLRKYYEFGWMWRDLLRDRPSVIIPDDHDVFQGNLWGHGGRSIPEIDGERDFATGGYLMPADWVNAVERTQTSHLPDPVDPQPIEQGIGVYFTTMRYGGLNIAIIEDRKFKSGPNSVLPRGGRRGDPRQLDVPDAQLLGERQERFLERWMREPAGDFRVVLSQTIFCQVTTHIGQNLREGGPSLDSNSWPQTPRNRALRTLGRNVIMMHGDQHIGALVRQGVDEWEDGPLAFMTTGTANGFPRAWWPDKPGENRRPGDPEWTGRFIDELGNRMTVLAVGNPEEGSNERANQRGLSPEQIAHYKGSGHGIVRFNRATGEVVFELWRLQFDAANPRPGDQFEGFAQTIQLR